MRSCCTGAPYPARQPDAEHRRPQGAGRRQRQGRGGARARWCAHFGLDVVQAYMGHVQDNAEEASRRLHRRCRSRFRVETDQGSASRSHQRRSRKRARRGSTSPAPARKSNNFNAPEPVTRAAVLYVFRMMVDEQIPMNAGCLRPIEIVIPEGSMLRRAIPPPSSPATSRPARIVELPVCRARRARLGAGHDEQPHLRQRAPTSITRRSARARRPAPASTARRPCRPT